MKPGAERMQRLSGNFFDGLNRRLADLQAAGCDVIRLDIGSPDQPPAPHILAALSQSAALPGSHGYQPHRGTRSLQEAWSAYYRRTHGVPLDPEREVVPLLGSKEGIFHLTLACVNPGDIVLVPDPGYLTYTQAARFAGAQVYPLPLLPERGRGRRPGFFLRSGGFCPPLGDPGLSRRSVHPGHLRWLPRPQLAGSP
jgi:LL-diaminopimelate aminotransferase